ncbi:phage major tail tube protein [Pseudomonas svalbardensis]|uniref:phage major tail tube protein n=1 Tax=Pseudomonas svalbardensis TaxID=3042029 RepID=UPI0024B3B903|nr:phage major tail tube protein [Pseudomonas sp. PMCC200367]
MAGFSAHRISNANVYLDGTSFFGKCEEIDLGTIKTVMSDFQGLGMAGLIELPDGIDKLRHAVDEGGRPHINVLLNTMSALTHQCEIALHLPIRLHST